MEGRAAAAGRARGQRRWQQWTEAEGRAAVSALARSGLSPSSFARSKGVSRARLAYWKKRLAGERAPTFVAVALPPAHGARPERSWIEIVHGDVVLRVREELDVEHVARLVRALGARGC